MGGFLEPIGHFERKRPLSLIAKGVELDERNPPLQVTTQICRLSQLRKLGYGSRITNYAF
jgi:hypothetical protein